MHEGDCGRYILFSRDRGADTMHCHRQMYPQDSIEKQKKLKFCE